MRFLKPHPVLQRSDIMSQVKRAVVRSPVRMVGFSTETGSMAILRFGAAEIGRPVHERTSPTDSRRQRLKVGEK